MSDEIEAFLADIEEGAVEVAGQMLSQGLCSPPTVFIFIDDWDPPLTAKVTTRPYRRGDDAFDAIAGLGDLPASVMATRLLVTWDESDLSASLFGPGNYADCFLALAATFDGHTLNRYPYISRFGQIGPLGVPIVKPEWGLPTSSANDVIPGVIEELLTRWRRLDGGDPTVVVPRLERAGYSLSSFGY